MLFMYFVEPFLYNSLCIERKNANEREKKSSYVKSQTIFRKIQ